MPASLEQIHRLIDESRLIREVDKARFKLRVKSLKPDELEKVQDYLESETGELVTAFNQVVEQDLNTDPESPLAEELNNFFREKNLIMVRAKESNSHEEEKEKLKNLMAGLEEPPKKSMYYLVAGVLSILISLGLVYWFLAQAGIVPNPFLSLNP